MNKPGIISLMIGSILVVAAMSWFSWQSVKHSATVANVVTNHTVPVNSIFLNTNETTSQSNTNIGVSPTNTSVTTTGNVKTFFEATADDWRDPAKTLVMPNKRMLVQYDYNLAINSSVSWLKKFLLGWIHSAAAANKKTEAKVLSENDWADQAPVGKAYMKVNWFCSAALTHLSTTGRGADKALGDFTGDCTNPDVSVKGNFMPTPLGEFNPGQAVNFKITSEHQWLGNATNDTTTEGLCVIDHIANAGLEGVYATQYTCDDGYSFGRTVYANVNGQRIRVPSDLTNTPTDDPTVHPDDIQFTVYVFPNNWASPTSVLDLLTSADKNSDDDGDTLTYSQEMEYKTNPNNSDSDSDGLGDFEEIKKYKTNPLKADTDGDGLKDGEEVAASKNPLGAGQATAEQLAAWGIAPSQPGKTVISDVKTIYSKGNLTVSWKNSPPADGIVNWGSTTKYGDYKSDFGFTSGHAITFPVTAGATIHYALRSCTPAPNSLCTVTADLIYSP